MSKASRPTQVQNVTCIPVQYIQNVTCIPVQSIQNMTCIPIHETRQEIAGYVDFGSEPDVRLDPGHAGPETS